MKIGVYLGLSILGLLASSLTACAPGYMKASELDQKEQGPSFCDARCHELGMRMGALVLVSNDLPGCVCQPLASPNAAEAPAQGASAATAGEVVIAAAAAAEQRQQQRQQQQQQQQQQSFKH
ncbi:MAG: hypothetical protein ABJB12_17290 [Pseudomonadota bacterium]